MKQMQLFKLNCSMSISFAKLSQKSPVASTTNFEKGHDPWWHVMWHTYPWNLDRPIFTEIDSVMWTNRFHPKHAILSKISNGSLKFWLPGP